MKESVDIIFPKILQEIVIFEESHQLAYNLLTAKNNLDEKFIFVEFDQDSLLNLSK